MATYIIRRLLLVPVLLFGVTVLIFSMLQFLSPEERVALYIRDVPRNARQMDAIITQYGLNKPIYEQYWRWLIGYQHLSTTGEMVRAGVHAVELHVQHVRQPGQRMPVVEVSCRKCP